MKGDTRKTVLLSLKQLNFYIGIIEARQHWYTPLLAKLSPVKYRVFEGNAPKSDAKS